MTEPTTRTLRQRVFSGALWTLLLRLATRVLGIATTLVVARVVPQIELGTFGVIAILDVALLAISSVGFGAAIVQMREDPADYVHTAWTAEVVRAFAVYALEFAVAPLWCDFFHAPEAVTPLRVFGIAQLVLGFHSMSTPLLMREMKFDKLFYVYASETLTQSIVVISLALALHSMWALIIGSIAGYVVRVIVSYRIHPFRPRLEWHWVKAKRMLRFTRWILAYSVADFALEMTDNAVTGRVLGKKPLAHYRMAYQLAMEAPSLLQWIIGRVAFPALASVQVKPETIRKNFRAMLAFVTVSMVPAAIGMAWLGDPLVRLVFGEAWAPAVAPFRILAFAAIIRSMIDVTPPLLRALGMTRADFLLRFVQVVTMIALLVPAVHFYGMKGIAWAVVIAALVTTPVWIWTVVGTGRIGLRDFADAIVPSVLVGVVVALGLRLLPSPQVGWGSVLLHGAVLLLAYAAGILALYRLVPSAGVGAIVSGVGDEGS